MTHGDLLLAQPAGCDVHAEAAWFLWSRVPLKLQRSLIWGPVANAQTEKLKDSELKMCVGWQQWAGVQARWVCHGQGSITAAWVLLRGYVMSLQEAPELPQPQGWDYNIAPLQGLFCQGGLLLPFLVYLLSKLKKPGFTFTCVILCVRHPGSTAQQKPAHATIPRNPCPRT